MILTKEQILERRLPTEVIELGDGQQIRIRAIPLHIMEQSRKIVSKDYGADAFLFAHGVIDEAGKRLYSDEDIPMIATTLETGIVNLVVTSLLRIGRVGGEQLEQIKKNLQTLGVEISGE